MIFLCNYQHIFFYNIAAKLKRNKNKKAKNTLKNNVYNFMSDIIVAIKMWSRCCKLLIDSKGLSVQCLFCTEKQQDAYN